MTRITKIWLCAIVILLIIIVFMVSLLSTKRPDITTSTSKVQLPTPRATMPHPATSNPLQASKQTLPAQQHAWKTMTVGRGDTLTALFNRHHLPMSTLYQLIKLPQVKAFILRPQQKIAYQLNIQGQILAIRFPLSPRQDLAVHYHDKRYVAKTTTKALQESLAFKALVIHHSLSQAAINAKLSAKIYKQLIHIFAGSVNLSRDIQPGNTLQLLIQQFYFQGKKYQTGHIVAAVLTTHNKQLRAIRYTVTHHSGYYTPSGKGIEPMFLSSPVHYKRISSRFSYHRYDPYLHKFRPHLGTDYAAKEGTPIHSIGNGRVILRGRDHGYGNAVVVRYSRHYKALYAHMSRFASNVHLHSYVHKGEVIGYVGATGWATGPNLHFEFYIDGIPHNWLTFKQPPSKNIPRAYRIQFQQHVKYLLALMKLHQATQLANNDKEKLTGTSS